MKDGVGVGGGRSGMPPEQEDEEVRAQQQHMMSGVMAVEGQSCAAVKLGGGKVARESNTSTTILA